MFSRQWAIRAGRLVTMQPSEDPDRHLAFEYHHPGLQTVRRTTSSSSPLVGSSFRDVKCSVVFGRGGQDRGKGGRNC